MSLYWDNEGKRYVTFDPKRANSAQLRFCMLGFCHISGKRIFMENAYRLYFRMLGPDDHLHMKSVWVEKNEFLIARIKGTI